MRGFTVQHDYDLVMPPTEIQRQRGPKYGPVTTHFLYKNDDDVSNLPENETDDHKKIKCSMNKQLNR